MTCSYCDSPLYGDKCQTCGGTAPSNANTSGLIAEIDAEMEGRQRGYADVRGELLFRCRDDLVTAASAQARIDAAESRADRLALALEWVIHMRSEMIGVPVDTEAANAWAVTLDAAADYARAALQQETQP